MDELHDYVETQSQQAFAAVVDRYADLVYASALRHVNHRAMAEDITQGVFALLAQKAHKVSPGRPVSAWLLTTTRNLAMNERRRRSAQRRLERTVAVMKQVREDVPTDWNTLGPLVDEGLSKLRETDRDALMLRVANDFYRAAPGDFVLLVIDPEQHHPPKSRVMRTGGDEFSLLQQLSLKGAMAVLVVDDLFERTAIADQCKRVHMRNRILQSHERTLRPGRPTVCRL